MAERTDQRLPRTSRLRRRGEFASVQDRGQKAVAGHLVLLGKANPLGRRRLGLTVSSKVGNAVVRTRVKRLLREAFRTRRRLLPDSVDAVIIARPGAGDLSAAEMAAEFEQAAQTLARRMTRKA